jgi:hypothetical protein
MSEYLARFFLGGLVVSAFAILGDVLRPKSFAGLFGAAPSVALATLGMAVVQHGTFAFAVTFSVVVERQTIAAFAAGLCAWAIVAFLAWWTWLHLRFR